MRLDKVPDAILTVALMEIHMRKVLILAAATMTLIGTSAMGQSISRDRDDDSRGRWYDGYSRWDRNRDDMRGSRVRDEDEDDRSGGNARFFVRSGDTQLRVVCGDRESTQACVDAALRMFDRVQSQPRSAGGSSAAPSSAPSSQ
ncbi:hypothetical protein [Microvirga rosea]|uniref:hypothetical protein n=1 Tax=Microvirga rosea TaxID=2715425 RepID=UPI001D0A008A|nr:hypothetical protein [Microvirga rosea]MCB8822293.1 hypothetical protein [Microvirga rosea]